jgi:hypothetical protein
VKVELVENSLIYSDYIVDIFVELSELLVYIEGGNRQNGYSSELVI